MTIYPAIDILGGKAVRLKQGRVSEATIYGDPLEMAEKWKNGGADWLHVVDLDGALEGKPRNMEMVRSIGRSFPSLKIQFGGGVRNMNTVEKLLTGGVQRAILGTAAVHDQDFVKQALRDSPDRIAIGIDAREGTVRVAGWTKESNIGAIELAQKLEAFGARIVIYTDIARDGVLDGPNVEATLDLIENTGLSVIASGGVSTIADVRRLGTIDQPRLNGVIIGKALYDGRFQLEEALTYAR
jgi:phosphoribosylformimino-5-aminoimidazole carboxamide ribotide isomerase